MKIFHWLGSTTPLTTDIGLLVVRLWFGGVLAVQHGWGKMMDVSAFVPHVAKLGLPAPALFAFAAAASEFAGGLLLALGLLTRLGAAAVAGTMAVAVFMAHRADPFARKEEAAAYGILALALLIAGPGRFSVDAMIAKKS